MEIVRFNALRPLLRWTLYSWVLLVSLGGGWLFSGCATPTPTAPAVPPVAHLVVINETDYLWRLVIVRSNGADAHDSRLQPRATLSLDFPGGDYVIEQTVLSEGASSELSRKLPVALAAGETYRWRLVTLLSEPTAPADLR